MISLILGSGAQTVPKGGEGIGADLECYVSLRGQSSGKVLGGGDTII